jgi:hypothetical protein
MDNSIKKILREAETGIRFESGEAAGMVEGVFQRAAIRRRKRTIKRSVLAATVVVGICLMIPVWKMQDSKHAVEPVVVRLPIPDSTRNSVEKRGSGSLIMGVEKREPDPLSAKQELARLDEQISAEEKKVADLLLAEKLNAAQTRLAEILPELKNDPTDRAAAAIVRQGDLLRESGLVSDAAGSYDQVVNYFPNSPAAVMAKQRLAGLESKG